MTHSTNPPVPPEDPQHYKTIADDYAATAATQGADNGDTEEENDESSSGDGGGEGSRKYRVFLDPILDFSEDEALSDEENAAEKLRKFEISSMSFLAAGASAFASENDLSRKAFMAKVAQTNKEIATRDIADPKLFTKLDEKQAERRARFGIRTLDEIVSGAIGAAGAVVAMVSNTVNDYVKDKKETRKASRLAQNFEEGKETYALDSEDDYISRDSLETADFPVQDFQGDELLAMERDRIYDDLARQTQYDLDDGKISYAEAFNILADVILLEKQPVRTVKLSEDIQIGPDAPGVDKELNPMGG
ncbi:MAG TPA: hypothetical protein DCM27_00145 [Rhodospirillaceae bacterium]|nr:hypothetical protein [Rhodospirillaceae bacterium]